MEAPQTQRKPVIRKLPAARRRRQIIQVAMRLFSAKGFEGTTTREIARAAGVSEAIIFRHFVTKEDLYAAIIDFIIQAYGGRFYTELNRVIKRKDDRAVFETLAFEVLETHRKEPALLRLLLFSGLEGHKLSQLFMQTQVRPIYQLLSEYISQRIKDKAFRKGDPLVLVRAFLGMVSHHSLIQVIFGDPFLQKSNREIAGEFAHVYLQGVQSLPSKRK